MSRFERSVTFVVTACCWLVVPLTLLALVYGR
jgi:hypothetical protein